MVNSQNLWELSVVTCWAAEESGMLAEWIAQHSNRNQTSGWSGKLTKGFPELCGFLTSIFFCIHKKNNNNNYAESNFFCSFLTFQFKHSAKLSNQSVTCPVLLMEGIGHLQVLMMTLLFKKRNETSVHWDIFCVFCLAPEITKLAHIYWKWSCQNKHHPRKLSRGNSNVDTQTGGFTLSYYQSQGKLDQPVYIYINPSKLRPPPL